MGVDAKLFEAWKVRPPSFLAHLDTGKSKGSAVQVDALHVVTCAHVFGDGEENFYESPAPLVSVIQRRATVRSGGFAAEGVVVAQHKSLDLALVRLARARPGIAPPPLLDEIYSGAACAVGIRRDAERLECLQQEIALDKGAVWSGGTAIENKFLYGPREGTSGGGVFAIQDGRLVLIGIARLGGERSLMGALIPAQALLEFLRKELNFKNPASPASDHEAGLVWEGIVPALEAEAKDYQLTLAFAALAANAAGPSRTVSFLSRRALSASQMRLQTPARVLPGHHRLAAWAARIEQADDAIQMLGGALQLKLRLPTPEELAFCWRAPASAAKAPEGRPLTLNDFAANELRIHVPPAGAYEWARDRNGNGYAVGAGGELGGMQLLPEAEVDAIAPGFRAAFEVEGL